MSYELPARVMHQSNVIRDTIKSLNDWEKEMKRKEAQHKAVNETEVRRNTFSHIKHTHVLVHFLITGIR